MSESIWSRLKCPVPGEDVCPICLKGIDSSCNVETNWKGETRFEGHLCQECWDFILSPLLRGELKLAAETLNEVRSTLNF